MKFVFKLKIKGLTELIIGLEDLLETFLLQHQIRVVIRLQYAFLPLHARHRVLTKIFTRFVKKKKNTIGKSVWEQTFDF